MGLFLRMVPRDKSQLSVQDVLNFPRSFNNTAEREVATPLVPVSSWPVQCAPSLTCPLNPQIYRDVKGTTVLKVPSKPDNVSSWIFTFTGENGLRDYFSYKD